MQRVDSVHVRFPTTSISFHRLRLLLLLLRRRVHLLAERHVRHLETRNGTERHVQNDDEEDGDGKAHEDG